MQGTSKVQETADDAALSKVGAAAFWCASRYESGCAHPAMPRDRVLQLSSVRAGYIADPFISYFVHKAQRRSPLINRGEGWSRRWSTALWTS